MIVMTETPGCGRRMKALAGLLAILAALLMASAAPGCGDGTATGRRPAGPRPDAGMSRTDGSRAKRIERGQRRPDRESAWDRFVRKWHEFWREEFGGEE
ncbi:MAG: hypothetical protein N3A38_08420 [Planctomycetota bacterium]|nr:hypothetical protein [Planctomycetota bacterium]